MPGAGHRPIIVYADGPDGPLPDPVGLAARLGWEAATVVLGWVVRQPAWLAGWPAPPGVDGGPPAVDGAPAAGAGGGSDPVGGLELVTLMVGPGLRHAVGDGRIRSVPTRLSAFPGLLQGRMKPDLAVVGAVQEGGWWRLAGSPGWAAAAAAAAGRVVVERWPEPGRGAAVPPPGQLLPAGCEVVAVLDRTDPPDPAPAARPDPGLAAIGRHVAGLVPAGATVQWGPGAVGAAVIDALERPVRVWSGLVTDELVALHGRGLLDGPARAAYLWGGPELRAMAAAGRLVLDPVSVTHDLTAVSSIERFVAINTALQVGLDGSVNVESVGGRVVAGPGGHPDFAAGAARSPGGLSVVALAAAAGGRSTIVERVEVVSTPRFDVDVVVTEYGVADLRGATPAERAARLVAVAAPEFRAGLARGC